MTLTMRDLFRVISSTQLDSKYSVSISYMEACPDANERTTSDLTRFRQVYNETIRDLLVPPELAAPLDMREDPEKGFVCIIGISCSFPD
jgi:hypothetical protein